MRKLTAYRIIELLEAPTEDRRPTIRHIEARAAEDEIVTALRLSTLPLTTEILCSMLGRRHATAAVPILIQTLHNADPFVRDATADALAKIGDPDAGPSLAFQLQREEDVGVQQTLAVALGACHYRPAIPALLELLEHPNATTRGCAAWSLGVLRAKEARAGLEHALSHETEPYPQARMEVALNEIRAYETASQ